MRSSYQRAEPPDDRPRRDPGSEADVGPREARHPGQDPSTPAVLARANEKLAAALDREEALAALADIVVPDAADWYVVDLLDEDGELRRAAVHHADPGMVARVGELEAGNGEDPAADGLHDVLRTGRSKLVAEVPAEQLRARARDDRHRALLEALEPSSYLLVPLRARGRLLGVMTYVFAGSGRRYTEGDRGVLEELTGRAALTLDNIRLIEELGEVRRRLEEQAVTVEQMNEELAVQNEELRAQGEELAAALAHAEDEHQEKAALLASTADGIYGIDRRGRCTFINAAGARLLAVDPAAALGRDMHRLIHHTRPDGQPYPVDECPIYRAFQAGESVRVEDEWLWRADGTSFPATYSANPLVRDGEVVGAVVAFTDDTERRAAEGRVQLLGRILDESLNEIYMFDPDTLRFVQVNRGGRENLGYSMAELRAMTPLDIKPEYTGEAFSELLEPIRTGREPLVRFETVHRRRDGSTYPVEVNLQLGRGPEGPLFVAVILDITDRRRAEQERERLITELEEANLVKAEFVSTMSHELRTPLNAVLGYTQLMVDGIPVEMPEEAKAHARRIALSGRHLLQLIDEILTFSKLEAGRETAQPFPILLSELLDEVRAVIEPLAEEKGLTFRASLEDAPPHFSSDPKKLRQILLNLTGNAVKFTRQGTIELRLSGDGDGGGLRIEVQDTGVGMTPDEQARAFEPFWQADQSSTREYGGTGLGLAITHRFVEILEGDIELRSGPWGTTFTVRLPRLEAPLPGAGPLDAPGGSTAPRDGPRT